MERPAAGQDGVRGDRRRRIGQRVPGVRAAVLRALRAVEGVCTGHNQQFATLYINAPAGVIIVKFPRILHAFEVIPLR